LRSNPGAYHDIWIASQARNDGENLDCFAGSQWRWKPGLLRRLAM